MIKVWKVETKEEIWSFEVGDLEVKMPFYCNCYYILLQIVAICREIMSHMTLNMHLQDYIFIYKDQSYFFIHCSLTCQNNCLIIIAS